MELPDERIDAGQARGSCKHIVGHPVERLPAPAPCRRRLDVAGDGQAEGGLHLPPIVAPAEFGDELRRILGHPRAGERRIAHFRE